MPAARYPFVLRERLGEDVYTAMIDMVEDRRDERLAGLDARLAAITERVDQRLATMDQRFATMDERLATLGERFERRLTEECGGFRLEVSGLRTEMARQHADLMKWAMLFWVGQAAAVAGIVVVLR